MKRRSERSKKGKAPHSPATLLTGRDAFHRVPLPASPALSPARRWLFRALALVLFPALLFGGLEGVLRLAGYGYSTGFFKPLRIGGREFLVENDKVGLRFFPPELARLPAPLRMPAVKPPNTCRIFIFGESAAMGDPEPAFGAGRYLQAMLRERFPGQNFEVVNVAMTAINSHVILPIARDCARQQGDLWLIYMGNNEMVGPFGAATVFGSQAPPLALVRFNLALQQTRLGQLLVALGRKLKRKSSLGPSWGGMQMFSQNRVGPNDPRRQTVYHNFQRNLADILRVGLDSGAKVLLSTVAVNLKDCPPFASEAGTNLPPGEQAQVQQLSNQGSGLAAQGNYAEAARLFEQATRLNPLSAELQFSWADCLRHATNAAQAREHYQLACDLDALPFRADSHINQLIKQAATNANTPSLELCDAAAALATNNLAHVCGQETFYEHVHFNFDGNYRLARLWAEAVERLLPSLHPSQAAPAIAHWATQDTCERRLGLTDWNRCNVLQEVLRRLQQPPLSTQANNSQRIQEISTWLGSLRQHLNPEAVPAARLIYQGALKDSPDDYRIHENFADFLQANREYAAAAEQWRLVRDLIPQDHVASFELGRLAALQGDYPAAQKWLAEALSIRPNYSIAWSELGQVHAAEGQNAAALEAYEQALRFEPQDFKTWYLAGLALSKLQRRAEAMEDYREALRLNPNFWEAHFELGGQLGLDGQFQAARTELETAIRLKPDFAVSHLNLGLALMKLGDSTGAEKEFQETLRLDPANRLAPQCLAQLRREKN